jgi:hypothetical protein
MGATAAINGLKNQSHHDQAHNKSTRFIGRTIKTQTKSEILELISPEKIISEDGRSDHPDQNLVNTYYLVIAFLDLLKHRVELFLLFGRNKLGASTKCITDQPKLG